MAPPSDPWQSCRFCLRASAGMRTLPQHDLLPHTEVAQLFEEITGSPLDCSPGYSDRFCDHCERRLRSAAQVRADFIGVAQRWQEIILRDGGSLLRVKTELELRADGENGESAPICGDFDMMFVNGKLDDTQDVNRWLDEHAFRTGTFGADNSRPKHEYDSAAPNDDDHFDANVSAEYLDDPSVDDIKPANIERPKEKAVVKIEKVEPNRSNRRLDYMVPPDGVQLTCDVCQAKFSTRVNLLYHMRMLHGPKSGRSCDICGLTNIRSLKQHMLLHQPPQKCAHCPMEFRLLCKLQAHERKHTRERPIVCDKCGFVFTNTSGLRKHMLLHENDADGTVSARFARQQVFRMRVQPCNQPETTKVLERAPDSYLECPLCQKRYANRPGLQMHVKDKHGEEGAAAWKHYRATVCVVCSMHCADAQALREHRRTHQAYQCDICMKRFDTRTAQELHTRMHAVRPRPFVCDICESKHHTQYALRVHHRRVHTRERPYPCVQCDRHFVDTTEMRAHVRKTHAVVVNVKSHKCEICPPEMAPFSSKHTLRKHMEIHTGESRFRCEVCHKRQSTTMHLLEHMRQFHPVELLAGGAV